MALPPRDLKLYERPPLSPVFCFLLRYVFLPVFISPWVCQHACFSFLRRCSLVPSLLLLLAAITTFGSGQEEKLIFG